MTLAAAVSGLAPPLTFSKAASGVLLAGSPASTWSIAGGYPAAGALTAGLNGGTYSTSSSVPTGSLPRQDPATNNAYLAKLFVGATVLGKLILCDRIWDNTVPNNTTGAQTIVTPTWPSRSADGLTAGLGLHIGLEITAAAAATAAVFTVGYTTPGGASETSTAVDVPTAAAPGIGRFYRLGWQAGGVGYGVKSIQNINFSTAWATGTFGLVVYRILAAIDLPVANVPNLIDALTAGFPLLYNGTTPFFLYETNATASGILEGFYQETNI